MTLPRVSLPITNGPFDLAATLDCGQSFRWVPKGGTDGAPLAFETALGDVVARVSMEGGELVVRSTSQRPSVFWSDYFAVDVDYAQLHRAMRSAPEMARCVEYAPGIRVLRQDFFETLISFIISQNNNIPRIKGIIKKLCELFGDPLPKLPYDDADCWHSFPSASRIASLSEDDLAPLHAGYRVPGILRSARAVASGAVSRESLLEMDGDSARKELMKLYGVGPKVADCVQLFGLGRFESFPMDVWMRRAMPKLFPNGLPEVVKPFAGIAQQYIFHYARTSGREDL